MNTALWNRPNIFGLVEMVRFPVTKGKRRFTFRALVYIFDGDNDPRSKVLNPCKNV